MLTVYGHWSSSNVRKVLWTCCELDLPFRHMDAKGTDLLASDPDFRWLNPNGLVPVVDEDGFVLWESNAIIRYLAAQRRRFDLLAEEPRARALACRLGLRICCDGAQEKTAPDPDQPDQACEWRRD